MGSLHVALTFIHTNQCSEGCLGNAVLWQGSCSCFVTKCLICGEIGYAWCGSEREGHEDEFNELAEALT